LDLYPQHIQLEILHLTSLRELHLRGHYLNSIKRIQNANKDL
jgi:hypothetical protein